MQQQGKDRKLASGHVTRNLLIYICTATFRNVLAPFEKYGGTPKNALIKFFHHLLMHILCKN